MAQKPYREITQEQAQQFLERGHIVIRQAFPRELAEEWRAFAFKRLGYDPYDPDTWAEPRVHLTGMNWKRAADIAPRAWNAICDLMGGEERIQNAQNFSLGDGFIINFNIGDGEPWQPPSPNMSGWHKDGDFFRHFLDSPEQGLLTIVIWSDIFPKSGGTFVAADSVQHIARYLAQHPEGLLPSEAGFGKLIRRCSNFAELTGLAGDIVLIHPYVLHSASRNPSGRARFITNPPVALKKPMNFNRKNPDDFSLVEKAVLKGLGVKRLDFKPTRPRERVVPERVARQKKMLKEQKRRLGIS